MDKGSIQKITLGKLSKIRNRQREVLLVFMGGDRNIEVSLSQIKYLARFNVDFSAYLTPGARRIIGENKILSAGASRVSSKQVPGG